MLDEHIAHLMQVDNLFVTFYNSLESTARSRFLQVAANIDFISSSKEEALLVEHRHAHSILKREMVLVQQMEFQQGHTPKDWALFIRDETAKQACFSQSKDMLWQWFNSSNSLNDMIRFYGNIKPEKSLDRKILFRSLFGTATQKNEMDARDIIRFRAVVKDIQSLVHLSVAIWQKYYDSILGCHNFYFFPKAGEPDDHYRAIHFQIETVPNRFVELQLMTTAREVVTFFDHALLFKKTAQFLNKEHEAWLRDFQLKGNIYDAKFLSRSGDV